eukprot:365051-Chlamydomonas_euryale.AAC.3
MSANDDSSACQGTSSTQPHDAACSTPWVQAPRACKHVEKNGTAAEKSYGRVCVSRCVHVRGR